jgi:hypothetical protein
LRSRLAGLITLPLALVWCEMGHALANLACGSPTETHELFEGFGRGLIAPLSALAAVAVLVALATRAAGVWASPHRNVSALPFALLAPLVFVVQEHLELLLEHHHALLGAERAPAFGLGLALQVPFALAAFLIARGLIRLADGVRALIARRRPPVRLAPWPLVAAVPQPVRRHALLRGASRSGRAPPSPFPAAAS